MPSEPRLITQPSDWWEAFEAEAERRHIKLAAFAGLAMMKMLPKEVRQQLSERPKPGRKKVVE